MMGRGEQWAQLYKMPAPWQELIYRFFLRLPSFFPPPLRPFSLLFFFFKLINKLFFYWFEGLCEFSLFVACLLIPLLFYTRTLISSNNMLFLGLRLVSLNCYICMLLNTQSFTVKCVCLRACASWVTIMGKVVWFKTSLFWNLTWNHAINLLSERQNIWKLQCCTTWQHWPRSMIIEKVSHISNIYIFLLSVSVSHDLK